MAYIYMSPQDAWLNRFDLIGRPVADAYWARNHGPTAPQRTDIYSFRFKNLKSVEIGPHAYTLVYDCGCRDELISYDHVAFYMVDLEKS